MTARMKPKIEITNPILLSQDTVDTSKFIKVVVELPDKHADHHMYHIDPTMSLSDIVDDICNKFAVPDRKKYSLLVGTKIKKVKGLVVTVKFWVSQNEY